MSRASSIVSRIAQTPAVTKFMSNHVDTIDGTVRKLTGGRISSITGWFFPELVLRSVGAKSGQARENTLLFARDAEGTPHIVGTNFGGDSHPAWTFNLVTHPGVRIVIDQVEHDVTAVQLSPDEMAEMWPRFDDVYSGYASYREQVGESRQLRMFRLDPR